MTWDDIVKPFCIIIVESRHDAVHGFFAFFAKKIAKIRAQQRLRLITVQTAKFLALGRSLMELLSLSRIVLLVAWCRAIPGGRCARGEGALHG
jgi:hypothetical protein